MYKSVKDPVTQKSRMQFEPYEAKTKPSIGRIYTVSPSEGDRFYLRVLLLHFKEAQSFDDLKAFQGNTFRTFKEAAIARGLVESDKEWDECLEEAASYQMPRQLRQFFVNLLLFCNPNSPSELWEKFKAKLSEDYSRRHDERRSCDLAKVVMERMLNDEGSSLAKFGIEVPAIDAENAEELWDREEELRIGEAMQSTMNEMQKKFVNKVFKKLKRIKEGKKKRASYYVDGIGGSGKTFVFRALCHMLRGKGCRFKCMAFTGVAATLLPAGQTIHRTFRFGVPLLPGCVSGIKPNSKEARELLETDVFICDEAPMCPKFAFEAMDKKLQELTKVYDVPFGGKVFIMSGDTRQCLPVKRYASQTDLIIMSVKNSKQSSSAN